MQPFLDRSFLLESVLDRSLPFLNRCFSIITCPRPFQSIIIGPQPLLFNGTTSDERNGMAEGTVPVSVGNERTG